MNVSDLIKQKGSETISMYQHESVANAASILVDENIGSVLVLDKNDQVVGILSERDIVYGMKNYGANLNEVQVKELMTTELIKCQPEDDLHKVMSMMTDRRVRHLPVFEGKQLLGIISIGDLVKNRIEEVETEAQQLREYISL